MAYKQVSPLPIIEGGTNAQSMTVTNGTNYFNGTSIVTTAVGTAGFVLTSNGAAAPTYQAVSASGATSSFGTDAGTATPAAGVITMTGGSNIGSTGAGSTVTFNLDNTVSVSGSMTAGTGLTATTGAITATLGNVVVTSGQLLVTNTVSNTDMITATNSTVDALAGTISLRKERAGGTIVSGDVLGNIRFKGYDGTTYRDGAIIRGLSSGTISSRIPTSIVFFTQPDSALGIQQRMTIAAAGGVDISTPTTGVGLNVNGGGITVLAGGITATGTSTINTTGASATSIGTGGTGVVNIGNATGNTAITGTLTTTAGITATTGAITATLGDFINTAGNYRLAATTATVGQITQAGLTLLHTFTSYNTFLGLTAGNLTLTGIANTGNGYAALNKLTSGGFNVAIGVNSLNNATTAGSCTAVGTDSLKALTTSGNNNTAIGYAAGSLITTGGSNVFLGYNAGSSYTGTESSNIAIGNTGTVAESNVVRIGVQGSGTGQQNSCFIAGITGATVTGAAVLCSTTGLLGTVVSSIKLKENVQDMDSSAMMQLRPVTFNFKATGEKGYGLIAEEVEEIMPDLVLYDDAGLPASIKYHEMPAMLLNEMQKLLKRIEQLEEKLKEI